MILRRGLESFCNCLSCLGTATIRERARTPAPPGAEDRAIHGPGGGRTPHKRGDGFTVLDDCMTTDRQSTNGLVSVVLDEEMGHVGEGTVDQVHACNLTVCGDPVKVGSYLQLRPTDHDCCLSVQWIVHTLNVWNRGPPSDPFQPVTVEDQMFDRALDEDVRVR